MKLSLWYSPSRVNWCTGNIEWQLPAPLHAIIVVSTNSKRYMRNGAGASGNGAAAAAADDDDDDCQIIETLDLDARLEVILFLMLLDLSQTIMTIRFYNSN